MTCIYSDFWSIFKLFSWKADFVKLEMYKCDSIVSYLYNEISCDSRSRDCLQIVVFRHCKAFSDKELVFGIRAGFVPTVQEEN